MDTEVGQRHHCNRHWEMWMIFAFLSLDLIVLLAAMTALLVMAPVGSLNNKHILSTLHILQI